MPHTSSFARARLGKAVRMLVATENRPARLILAYKHELLRLRPNDFPPALRRDFAMLILRLTHFRRHLLHKLPTPATPAHAAHNAAQRELDALIDATMALYRALHEAASDDEPRRFPH